MSYRVTVNNEFLVPSEVICQVTNIIDKSQHEWPKIVIHGNEYIITFLTRYFMSSTHNSTNN